MKTKIKFLLIWAYLFTNCDNSSELDKIKLDSASLKSVVQSYNAYQNLVSLRVNFITQINNNFAKSSKPDTDQISRILKKYGTIENLVQNSSKPERAIFSQLSLDSELPLKNAYDNLIVQLNSKYEFDENLLRGLLINDVISMLSTSSPNGRTAIGCESQCSNAAEAFYWKMYDLTRDVDLAAYGATAFMTGCLVGCAAELLSGDTGK
jgi:hypothetical protein